jgi:hypothetical protein
MKMASHVSGLIESPLPRLDERERLYKLQLKLPFGNVSLLAGVPKGRP